MQITVETLLHKNVFKLTPAISVFCDSKHIINYRNYYSTACFVVAVDHIRETGVICGSG